jgi:hypothetical protein
VKLQSQIRHIFLDIWDPIGFGDQGVPPDEYDSYILPICSMIVNSREYTVEDFAEFLKRSERDITGTPLDIDRIYRTAERLMALRREVQSS